MVSSHYGFDRPVFILAAPRSGSTLLFETLVQSRSLWSIGDESHGVFERHPQLRPGKGCDNNRLTELHATAALTNSIRHDFLSHIRDCEGVSYNPAGSGTAPRMLEKTPKNALRIPFLNKIFPDALFIYLHRDPKENLSSIMEAWRGGKFVMYPRNVGRNGPWSLLLPPGWREVVNKPLADIAAFQWQAVHSYVVQDLGKIPSERWVAVNYAEFLENTSEVCEKLCRFMGVEFDDRLQERASNPLPMSRYTMSNPTKNKWHHNAIEIARVLPNLKEAIEKVNLLTRHHCRSLDDNVVVNLNEMGHLPKDQSAQQEQATLLMSQHRNQACYCGSGKKYKHCCGKL